MAVVRVASMPRTVCVVVSLLLLLVLLIVKKKEKMFSPICNVSPHLSVYIPDTGLFMLTSLVRPSISYFVCLILWLLFC